MSGRRTHYAGGAALGLGVGIIGHAFAGWGLNDCLGLAAVSGATGGGHLSMDYDQGVVFRWLRRNIGVARWLGEGGPFSHRGILHWGLWPLIIAGAWWVTLARIPALGPVWWIGWGVAIGWASHVILDMLYGHDVHTQEGALIIRHGIPWLLWYDHRGGIWTSSGPGSSFAGFILAGAVVWEAWLLGVLVHAVIAALVIEGAGEVLDLLGSRPKRRSRVRVAA